MFLQKKYIGANGLGFVNKELRKALMRRVCLQLLFLKQTFLKTFLKQKIDEWKEVCKKQRNLYVSPLKGSGTCYRENIDPKSINDKKIFSRIK